MASGSSKPIHADGTYRVGIVIGLATGAIVFVAGFVLCILGLTGSIQLIFEGPGITAKLTNASPGIVFALLGVIVLWRFKPRVTHTVKTEEKKIDHFDNIGGATHRSSYTTRNESTTSGARLASRE